MECTVSELAALVGGEVVGSGETRVTSAADVRDDAVGRVVLASSAQYLERAFASGASCIITGLQADESANGASLIRVGNPEVAFARALQYFKGVEAQPPVGIGPGAVVAQDAVLGEGVAVGANCFVGSGVELGDGCVLYPGVYIGDGVRVGSGCRLYPGAKIYPNCRIGSRVILHAGCVIGADGFGYVPDKSGLVKYPHIGTVEIGDDVEIGANSTIDRAKTGATVIGNGTKIDNLVHIAHNVKIGSHCVIVALSGIAGSAEIGNGVTLAAQTGVKDHVRIGDGAVVAARAGVIGDLADGCMVSGFPARDHRTEKRVQAASLHLPEVLTRLRVLEKEIKELRARIGSYGDGDTEHSE